MVIHMIIITTAINTPSRSGFLIAPEIGQIRFLLAKYSHMAANINPTITITIQQIIKGIMLSCAPVIEHV